MVYLNQSVNKQMWSMIKQNPCCDHIQISESECDQLEKLFNLKFEGTVPCDLIVTHTVPLKNMKITLSTNSGSVLTFCIHIFGCCDADTLKENKSFTVGALRFSDNEFVLIDVEYGKNIIFQGFSGFKYDSNKEYLNAIKHHMEFRKKNCSDDKDYTSMVGNLMGCAMEAFYVIQIALLHPITKQLFKNPSLFPDKDAGKKGSKKKKRITKYIKKYYIDPLELESIVNHSTGSKKTYSCLAWYVCGHWRTYQNGTKVFIQPYWKGVMRNEKEFVENIERTRKIGQLMN